MQSRFTKIAVAILFLVAVLLRLWGIDFGLPHLYHPDEWALVMPALRILQTGDLNPQRFDYGSLHIYLLAALYGVYSLYGISQGSIASVHDLPVYDSTHGVFQYEFPEIYLLSRGLTAVLGAATVIVVFLIGRRLFDRRTGLVTALLVAILPLHVVNSHYVTTDVPGTFFVALGLLGVTSVFLRGTMRDYILAGALIGFATGAKYPNGLLITSLVAAHLGRERPAFEGPKLLVGTLAAGVAFLLSTPFAILDYENWRFWLDYVNQTYSLSDPLVEGSSARWYATFLLQQPYTLITISAVLGLAWVSRRNWRQGLLLGSFPITHFLAIAQYERRYPRALMPAMPFLALLAAVLVVQLARNLTHRSLAISLPVNGLVVVLSAVVIALPVQASILHAHRFTQKELRTLGREWMVDNIPEGSRIAIDAAAPVLPPDRYQVDIVGWSIAAHDVDWYRQHGYEYVVLSEVLRRNASRTVEDEARYEAFMQDDQLDLVAEIEGPLLSYPAYHLWVYRLQTTKDNATELHQ